MPSAGKVQTKRQWYQLQADGSLAISNKLDSRKPDVLTVKGSFPLSNTSCALEVCTFRRQTDNSKISESLQDGLYYVLKDNHAGIEVKAEASPVKVQQGMRIDLTPEVSSSIFHLICLI